MRRGLGILAAVVLVGAALLTGGASASDPLGLTFSAGGNNGPATVYVAQADGSHARKIGTGDSSLLAPNGKSFAYSPQKGSSVLVIASASGAVIGKFFSSKVTSAYALAWSPNSRYLAVQLAGTAVPVSKYSGVAIIDTHTGKSVIVAQGTDYGGWWSPNGNTLVYGLQKSGGGPINLFTSNVAGSSIQQLTHNGDSQYPVWGKLGVAFSICKNRGRTEEPACQIYLLHNGHTTQITHVSIGPLVDGLSPFDVSANGQRLLAEYEGTDTSKAYTVDLATHATHEVIVHGQSVVGWAISRNGRRLLVVFGGFEQSPNHGKVESVPWGGGTPTVLEAHGADPSWNQ